MPRRNGTTSSAVFEAAYGSPTSPQDQTPALRTRPRILRSAPPLPLFMALMLVQSCASYSADAAPGSTVITEEPGDDFKFKTWEEMPEEVRREGENLSHPRKDEILFRYSLGQLTAADALRFVRDCWLLLDPLCDAVRTRRGTWVGVVDGQIVFGPDYDAVAEQLLEIRPNLVGVAARAMWPIDI